MKARGRQPRAPLDCSIPWPHGTQETEPPGLGVTLTDTPAHGQRTTSAPQRQGRAVDAPRRGDSRKATACAISCGETQPVVSASGMAARFCGVSMTLGNTQLTRTPCAANSAAIDSLMRCTACLAAQ